MTLRQNYFSAKQAKCGNVILPITAAVLAVQHNFVVCYSNLGIAANPVIIGNNESHHNRLAKCQCTQS